MKCICIPFIWKQGEMSRGIIQKQSFSAIEERVKKEFGFAKDIQLIELLGIPYQTYSSRKRRGDFSEEWVIFIHLKWNLQINWILTGEGNKYIKEGKKNVECKFLETIDEWISDLKKKDMEGEAWFRFEFKKLFPDFKEWLNAKESEGSKGELIRSRDAEAVT